MRTAPLVLISSLAACAAVDGEPPVVGIRGPQTAAGLAVFEIDARDERPGLSKLTAQIDGRPAGRVVQGRLELDTSALIDGAHELRVVAVDGSLRGNRAEVSWSFAVDNRAPTLELVSSAAAQGRTLGLWLKSDEALVGPTAELGERRVPFYPVDGGWRALIGLAIRQPAGPTEVRVRAADAVGNGAELSHPIEVAEVDFPRGGTIRLSRAQTAARKDSEARERTRAEREAAYAHPEPTQLWAGTFIKPIEARTSSEFGRFREYSTGERWHHDAVDLTTGRGKPLVASADGVVVLAREQAIFGNAVILSHGQGVLSSYAHLDRIDVAEGDRVGQGQPIGLLGSTGQSTGPHVHWGVVVAGEAVDPMQWLDEAFMDTP